MVLCGFVYISCWEYNTKITKKVKELLFFASLNMYRMSSFVLFVQLGAVITCHAVICAFTWKRLQAIWTPVLVRALWLTREILHQCLTWKNCNSKIIHCLLSYNADVKFYSVFAVLCFAICFYILYSFALNGVWRYYTAVCSGRHFMRYQQVVVWFYQPPLRCIKTS